MYLVILSIINNDNTISPAFRKYVAGCFNQIYINASLQTTLITFMDGITSKIT
jgi:hypothetical protein